MKPKQENHHHRKPRASNNGRRTPGCVACLDETVDDVGNNEEKLASELVAVQKDSMFDAYRDVLTHFTSSSLLPLIHRNEPMQKKKQRSRSSSPYKSRSRYGQNSNHYNNHNDPIRSSKSPLVLPHQSEIGIIRPFEVQPVRSFEVQPVEHVVPHYAKSPRQRNRRQLYPSYGARGDTRINRVNSE